MVDVEVDGGSYSGHSPVRGGAEQGESFVANASILSRVEVYFVVLGSGPTRLDLHLREAIDGTDLAMSSRDVDTATDSGWISFPFSGVNLTVGHTYYLVVNTPNGHVYSLGVYVSANYADGQFCYRSVPGTWQAFPEQWLHFITYTLR